MPDEKWHESDSFWKTLRPALFGDSRVENAPGEVDGLLRLSGIEPGDRVLDLACGIGRHSLEFARRGFVVTGVDRTAAYIEEAKKRAAAEGLSVEFLLSDMRTFATDDTFDLVICLFTSLGYFDDRDDDRRVVENVARSLKPGGVFIVDIMGRETLKRIFQPRQRHEEDGVILIEEAEVSEDWDQVETHWTIIEGDSKREVRFSLYVYSSDELSGLLRDGGLEGTGTYGGYDGSPYDEGALRLIEVARRP